MPHIHPLAAETSRWLLWLVVATGWVLLAVVIGQFISRRRR